MQWETACDDSLSARFARGGLHSVSDVRHWESKIAALKNILKGLSPQMPLHPRLLQCLVLITRP